MRNRALIAAAATILLHAGLLAAVVAGLIVEQKQDKTSETLTVRLLPPAPAPLPAAPPVPPQTAMLPPPPKKERVKPLPRPEPRPVRQSKTTTPAHVPETPSDPKPSPAIAQPASPAPAAGPATTVPTAPAAPARTSASEASYAATNRTPPYPRIALTNGDEGTVVLRVLVTAEGTAGAVEIKSSSGHSLLDESARKTVQTWRFKPATVDGKPVAEWYQVPIPFKLQNN